MNDDLIDHGTYYEIKDYKATVLCDDFGVATGLFYCPIHTKVSC